MLSACRANPWNGLQTLHVNLLLAVEALAERALTDPFQRGVDCTQERSVPRFLAEVYFSCQRRVGPIALVFAVVVLLDPRTLGQAQPELAVARL